MAAQTPAVGMERKLAAIFSTDVAGYSRLMGDDEEATIRTLTAYREVISSLSSTTVAGWWIRPVIISGRVCQRGRCRALRGRDSA